MVRDARLQSPINIHDIIQIAREAGELILEVYSREDLFVEYKEDDSPLTLADRRSHERIKAHLRVLYPDIPLVSEEQRNLPYQERKDWPVYWLVDPLDGTKEFIKRNGEFTVNIAMIVDCAPYLGVIFIPDRDELYYAERGKGAWKIDSEGEKKRLPACRTIPGDQIKVVASRSHKSKALEDYVQNLKKIFPVVDYVSSGSSLKLCLVAEGKAHIYPRLAPTMEWDTAAGHAIVNEAGGVVVDCNTHQELRYNKQVLRNNHFIAYDTPQLKSSLSGISESSEENG